jgi:hypothetical protein
MNKMDCDYCNKENKYLYEMKDGSFICPACFSKGLCEIGNLLKDFKCCQE